MLSPLFCLPFWGTEGVGSSLLEPSRLMLTTLVCPGWLESHPECPARSFLHLYSWITFKCWTSRRQISRSAWGGLTCSSSVLKQKRRNCHLDSLSWLNKLAERLAGPKGSSSISWQGKIPHSPILFFFVCVFLCGLLGFIFVCLIVFGSLPQSPVGSAERGDSLATGSHVVVPISCWFTCLSTALSSFPRGNCLLQKWFLCLMRRGPKSPPICVLLFSQMANYVAQFWRWPLHRDCSRLSVVLSHPFKWRMGEMGSLHTWPPRRVI